MAIQRKCPCGKRITGKRKICLECEDIYGIEASEWPEWFRFVVNDTQKEYRSVVDDGNYISDNFDFEEEFIDECEGIDAPVKRTSLLDRFDEDGLLVLRCA